MLLTDIRLHLYIYVHMYIYLILYFYTYFFPKLHQMVPISPSSEVVHTSSVHIHRLQDLWYLSKLWSSYVKLNVKIYFNCFAQIIYACRHKYKSVHKNNFTTVLNWIYVHTQMCVHMAHFIIDMQLHTYHCIEN